MNRILLLIFLLAGTGLIAQNSKVVSAYNSMKAAEFGKAMEYINAATENEKTMADEKTWRYRGEIYQQIAMSEEDFGVDKKTAIEEALKSFNKAQELDEKERWGDEIRTGLATSQNLAVNSGIEAYNQKDYENSRDFFLMGAKAAEELGVFDTLAVYNGGLAAEQAEDYEEAVTQYKKATDVGYLGPKMYLYIANIYQKQENDEAYLKAIQEGRQKYPEDGDLIVYELNYYLRTDQFQEAENNLKLAIEKEPENKQLHYSLGVVYDKLGRTEEAVASYKKALEIDPAYFDATYNLGAMYFNEGVEMNNASNEIKDNKKYNAARDAAKEVFMKSKPYLEKAHEIDATDVGAISSLSQLYAMLGENEKYTEMKKKLEAAKN